MKTADVYAHRDRLANTLATLVTMVPAERREEAVQIASGIGADFEKILASAMQDAFTDGLNIRQRVVRIRDWWRRCLGRS